VGFGQDQTAIVSNSILECIHEIWTRKPYVEKIKNKLKLANLPLIRLIIILIVHRLQLFVDFGGNSGVQWHGIQLEQTEVK